MQTSWTWQRITAYIYTHLTLGLSLNGQHYSRNVLAHFTFMWPCIVTNFFVIKQTRRKNFPNFVLSKNSTYSGHFLCPSSGFFYRTFGTVKFRAVLMTASKKGQIPSWLWLEAVIKHAWNIQMPNIQWKTPDDGQRKCPKPVEFLTK